MAGSSEVKAHCPSCGAKYKLPVSSLGRKARCAKCQTLFRVMNTSGPSPDEPPAAVAASPATSTGRPTQTQTTYHNHPKHVPTEDDIIRWLAEAESEADRERRIERDEDGLDAFDMPATTCDVIAAMPSRLISETAVSAPRLRRNDEDSPFGPSEMAIGPIRQTA